jgi:hypothetical protein
MDNTKFTKGKWEVLITDEVDSHLDIAINSVNQDCVAWVYSKSLYKDINGKANALLISKAPEMLEMLKKIMKTYDKGTQNYLDCQKLIKEATEI